MFSGGTVYVDHASGVIKIHHQVSLGASGTVRSKELMSFGQVNMGYQSKST